MPASPMGLQVFFRPSKGFLAQLLQTTMISAGNSNEIEDRSAYSLPSPFSLQAKATPVPLLWESDEGNGKSGLGVFVNRDNFHALRQ